MSRKIIIGLPDSYQKKKKTTMDSIHHIAASADKLTEGKWRPTNTIQM